MSDVQTPVQITLPMIAEFCRRWKITELALFGSVRGGDFRPDSDVLVTFAPNNRWSLFDFMHAEQELSSILGRRVDLVERQAVERSHNHFISRSILRSARMIYAT